MVLGGFAAVLLGHLEGSFGVFFELHLDGYGTFDFFLVDNFVFVGGDGVD